MIMKAQSPVRRLDSSARMGRDLDDRDGRGALVRYYDWPPSPRRPRPQVTMMPRSLPTLALTDSITGEATCREFKPIGAVCEVFTECDSQYCDVRCEPEPTCIE